MNDTCKFTIIEKFYQKMNNVRDNINTNNKID